MKNRKFVSILGLAIIFSLLLAVVPALPALAYGNLSLSPATGPVDTTVYISGDTFTHSSATVEYYAEIYFSDENKALGTNINTVLNYSLVSDMEVLIDTTGVFDGSFQVPSQLSTTGDAVTTGTYYVYITYTTYNTTSGDTTTFSTIQGKDTFTVTGSGTLSALSPASGPAGTDVTISGTGFLASSVITFKYDTTTLTPKSGSVITTSAGAFISVITIPTTATVGAHTISVKVGTPTATATFTVTASAALDPLSPTSGPAGTEVLITGGSFTPSAAILFKLDGTTTLTPKTGTDTAVRSSGSFISTVTIPANTAAGAHTITIYYATAPTVGVATATFTVTASASLSPLSPLTGPPGTDVTITGANFPANAAITFRLNTTTLTPKAGSLVTGSNGSFMTILTVPANTTNGAYLFTITAGGTTVTASFTVTGATTTTSSTTTTTTTTTPTSSTTTQPPSGTILLTGGTHAAGSIITLIGMGFTAGLPVTFTFDAALMGQVNATSDGFAPISYTIPAGTSGNHTINASDGIKTGHLAFPVESTPPPTPQPLKPGLNALVKSPVTFSWLAVTDESLPVTYDLQISSDANFTAGTILIDKTKITAVEYTLTPEELMKLSNAKTNYYWREKSVDGALNESAWSPTSAFTVSQPFKFEGTPLYITFAVIGVVLFLAGFLLGRRMAFSY
jgi:hypothetical protein